MSDEKRNAEVAHKKLSGLIFSKGERFRKKHGDFIRLQIIENLWLIMDSWNKSIHVVKGKCDYDNMYTGFKNIKKLNYLGGNFGGFNYGEDAETIDYYYDIASKQGATGSPLSLNTEEAMR